MLTVNILGHEVEMSEEALSCYMDAEYRVRNRQPREADDAMNALQSYIYMDAHYGKMPFNTHQFDCVWGDRAEFFKHIHAQLKDRDLYEFIDE